MAADDEDKPLKFIVDPEPEQSERVKAARARMAAYPMPSKAEWDRLAALEAAHVGQIASGNPEGVVPEGTRRVRDAIVAAAQRVGWKVFRHVAGSTPDSGAEWSAEVFCFHPISERAVAFRIQWHRGTWRVPAQILQPLKACGIELIWLSRYLDIPVSKDFPAFGIHATDLDRHQKDIPVVLVPSWEWSEHFWQPHSWPISEQAWAQQIPADVFAEAVLNGAHFIPGPPRRGRESKRRTLDGSGWRRYEV